MKELTQERLKKAGWNQERHINIDIIKKTYEDAKIKMPIVVERFLEQFGLLLVEFQKNLDTFETKEIINFNPVEAMGDCLDKEYFEDIVSDFPEIGECELFPVGTIARGNMILMMTEDEKFFSYTDGCLCKDGNSIVEMLDCVVGEYNSPIIYD